MGQCLVGEQLPVLMVGPSSYGPVVCRKSNRGLAHCFEEIIAGQIPLELPWMKGRVQGGYAYSPVVHLL